MRMQVLPNGDLIANAVPVIMLLSYAYDVPVDPSPRLSHLPDWTIRERYDIEGKAIANAVTLSLQYSDSRTRIQQEIRGLLAVFVGVLALPGKQPICAALLIIGLANTITILLK
jgi:hypothetical protein